MKSHTMIATLSSLTTLAMGSIPELPASLYTSEIDSDLISTIASTLPESSAIDAEFLDSGYQPIITLSEDASVSVVFLDEGAGYRNTLGWIAITDDALSGYTKGQLDTDGSGNVSLVELGVVTGIEYGLVFPNVSRSGSGGLLQSGDSLDIDDGRVFDAGTQIVFCLLQNAWKYGEVEGYSIELNTTTTVYSADMINPESPSSADLTIDSSLHSARHVAMLFRDQDHEQIIMGFEDLHRTDRYSNDYSIYSDEDFNDAVFLVSSTPASAISDADIAEADPAFNPRPPEVFSNPDCCSVDTTQILEVELPERTNVNAAFMDPSYVPTVIVSQSTLLVLSFVGEGAIYQNSLGYLTYPEGALDAYTFEEIDADGDGVVEPFELRSIDEVEIGMAFAHASVAGGGGAIVPTEAIILGNDEIPAGNALDFFLVQDGWNDDRTVKDYLRDTGEDTLCFYTLDKLNPETDPLYKRHVAMMFTDDSFSSVLFGFEDLHRLDRELNPQRYESDEDFNDNVFCISPMELGALAHTDVPVAGGCAADLDSSGVLNFFDIARFLELFTENDLAVDFNDDALINYFDIVVFINLFINGCA